MYHTVNHYQDYSSSLWKPSVANAMRRSHPRQECNTSRNPALASLYISNRVVVLLPVCNIKRCLSNTLLTPFGRMYLATSTLREGLYKTALK